MAETYPISSRDYLMRAETRLEEISYESMFYAAFELRCGIEARLQEYMENWSHIPEKRKKGWQFVKLGRSLESAFRTGDKVVRWEVWELGTRRTIACFYHTPVSRRLRDQGGRLGGYLHVMKHWRPADDPWWDEFRANLIDASAGLRFANTGTLLGPPMQRKGTSHVEMNMEFPPGTEIGETMENMMHGELIVNVSYLETLPDPLEAEAVVWNK